MPRRKESSAFLKECMADALLALMKEKAADKITAEEIAKKAGVGRATYFRAFGSKKEAVTYKYTVMWLRWAEEHGVRVASDYALENLRTFLDYNWEIRETTLLVYGQGMSDAIFESFRALLSARDGADTAARFRMSFFAYGLFALIDEWAQSGFAQTAEELTAFVKPFLPRI